LLTAVATRLDTSHVEEVTLEANPEDVTHAWADALADTQINRVSMGVQTFVDEELKTIRRRHDSHRATEAVAALRAAGFRNLSIDLMYGLPGQTLESFTQSISRCLELNVEHISAYCLSVEEGTLLARRVSGGGITLPDEEQCLTYSQMLRHRLKEAGYIQYEISNYARPGYHSRHNSSYWVGTPYLGLGPGAHSFDGRFCRSWNAPDVKQYIEGQRHRESEQLDARDRYHETVMLGLRTRVGVSASALQTYLNDNPELAQHFHQQHQIIETEGLLHTLPDGNIALTESGLNLADDVIRRLFLPED
jgi:oxygen-independent coproporphyrinogen-3 oxidase